MKIVNIWTDGACSGNPGKGGWCAYLKYNDVSKIISGNKTQTTNNEMELLAVINGLNLLKEPCVVNIMSDSAYVINAFKEKWIINWANNNWMNSKKQQVANKELWLELLRLTHYHSINFVKVKGHSTDINNNICDEYARKEINKLK